MIVFVALNILLPGIILSLLLYLGWFVYKEIEIRVRKLPPGPLGIPILGYLPFINRSIFHKECVQFSKKYGKIFQISTPTSRIVIISDLSMARQILNHPSALDRPPHIFDYYPGKAGFSTLNGKDWQDGRKLVMQLMKNIGLGKDNWSDIIQDEVAEFNKSLSTSDGNPILVDEMIPTTGIKCMIALVLGRRNLKLIEEQKNMIWFFKSQRTVKEHFENLFVAIAFPWLVKYFVKFNLLGYTEKIKAFDNISSIIRSHIKERVDGFDYDASSDFIMQYLSEVKKINPTLQYMDRHLYNCLGNIALFINTSDTGMVPVQWIMFVMAAYPEIQAKVHAEIDDVMGRDGIISWEDRERLPYSMACINEVSRWMPGIPLLVPRCASETFEFQGYCIPKGSFIMVNAYAINRDPENWDQPDKFMPERFIQNDEKNTEKQSGSITFSYGKRSCPAEKVSMMILFLYFTTIMQKFTVKTPSGCPPDLNDRYCVVALPQIQPLCFVGRKELISFLN